MLYQNVHVIMWLTRTKWLKVLSRRP